CLASLHEWLRGRYWVAAAWFAAALLAKEEVAAFPLVLAMLPPSGKAERGQRPALATMLVLALAAGMRTAYVAISTPGVPLGLAAGISPARYFLAEGTVILRYLRLLFVPYG